jgi:ABC-type Fe3+-hydroxamate transport system substrate-binding protein
MTVRVVSLVPSATETLDALGCAPIACTRFCDRPGLPTVGGTKNPDVAAIVACAPDLVVVNDEENRLEDARALEAAGLRLHSMSPRRLVDVEPAVRALAAALECAPPPPFDLGASVPVRATALTLTWRRPFMTMNRDTYGSSVLDHLGYANACDVDARYPEIDLPAFAPDVVLLPDEPYAFTERHVPEVQEALPDARVLLVDGRDLFWWGIRTSAAIVRLRALLSR